MSVDSGSFVVKRWCMIVWCICSLEVCGVVVCMAERWLCVVVWLRDGCVWWCG